jgi:hypothetical protein
MVRRISLIANLVLGALLVGGALWYAVQLRERQRQVDQLAAALEARERDRKTVVPANTAPPADNNLAAKAANVGRQAAVLATEEGVPRGVVFGVEAEALRQPRGTTDTGVKVEAAGLAAALLAFPPSDPLAALPILYVMEARARNHPSLRGPDAPVGPLSSTPTPLDSEILGGRDQPGPPPPPTPKKATDSKPQGNAGVKPL